MKKGADSKGTEFCPLRGETRRADPHRKKDSRQGKRRQNPAGSRSQSKEGFWMSRQAEVKVAAKGLMGHLQLRKTGERGEGPQERAQDRTPGELQ